MQDGACAHVYVHLPYRKMFSTSHTVHAVGHSLTKSHCINLTQYTSWYMHTLEHLSKITCGLPDDFLGSPLGPKNI